MCYTWDTFQAPGIETEYTERNQRRGVYMHVLNYLGFLFFVELQFIFHRSGIVQAKDVEHVLV
jgi:hypothetical protein